MSEANTPARALDPSPNRKGNVQRPTLNVQHRNRKCEFSPGRKYRYTLWRQWGSGSAYAMFIGLNPSTADETRDDPTIRRCIAFAQAWGFPALCMTNLFAWRDTKPANMKKVSDPMGPLNGFHLFRLAREAGVIIAAWGQHGSHLGRAAHTRDLFDEAGFAMSYLRLNKDGSPGHPLYIPAATRPTLWL